MSLSIGDVSPLMPSLGLYPNFTSKANSLTDPLGIKDPLNLRFGNNRLIDLQTAQASTQAQQPMQTQQQINSPAKPLEEDKIFNISKEDMNKYLLKMDPSARTTKNGNIYQRTDTFKKLGFLFGLSTPLVTELYNTLNKGGSIGLKNVLLKSPIFAIAGIAGGTIVDLLINKEREKIADKSSEIIENNKKHLDITA